MLFSLHQKTVPHRKSSSILKKGRTALDFFLNFLFVSLFVVFLSPIPSFGAETRGLIKEIPFVKNQVIDLSLCLFTVSQIQLSEGEAIRGIQNGDKMAWQIDVDTNLNNSVFIKPVLPDSSTNLIILTTKRNYYFSLHSFTGVGKAAALQWYALKFTYPKEEKEKEAQKLPEVVRKISYLQWRYSYHGPRYLMPEAVFDDGNSTYFRIKPNLSLPALFAVESKKGKEAVVNFRRVGNYLVVYQVAPQFTLRWKNGEVGSVFNETWIRNSHEESSSAQ